MSSDASESDTEQSSRLHKHEAEHKQSKWGGWTKVSRKAQGGWKPRSMSAPVLIPITLLSLVIAAAIEILAQRSRINGGLGLAPTPDGVPQYAMLSYLYLPTVVAVILSLIWNWVDLDVKRMQPWFELSKPEGATAHNSLFLDYPYDFAGFVPFKAAKRRHWPVFLSSTVVVAIFWLVTPLQSSILGTGTISRVEPVSLATRSRLVSVEEQYALITPQILTTGYSIGWLGQEFPPFMTASYATLPFYVENDPGLARPQTNWTATTTKLSTELECWPAEVQVASRKDGLYSFSNGQGCNVTTILPNDGRLYMRYSGYYSGVCVNPSDSLSFSKGCPLTGNVTHQFLAFLSELKMGSPTSNPSLNITALYCQPYYYKQQVSISVAADNIFRPDDASIVALSPKEKLTEKEFNSTAFETLIANGCTEQYTRRDYPFMQEINQLAKMDKTDLLPGSTSNMVGYALAGHNEPAYGYSDPKKLQEAFNRAHQYLFSLAVNYLLINETDFPDRAATSSYALSGIVVSRPISAVVEALLVVAAFCILALLWACQNSMSNLESNPSSISSFVQIFRGSQDLNQLFFSVDCADDKSLSQLFPDDKFRLSRNTDGGDYRLAIERVSQGTSDVVAGPSASPRGYYKPFRPISLRRVSGIFFILIQIGAIVTVSYLKVQETRQKGLARPSDNFEVLQLLENFIPTIFATLTEPFLVLLNRFFCVLQPFQALSLGRSVASKSIDIIYASIPPQLVIWRAIKRRHFLLVILCIVALLSNVLAVGLSALFKESPTIVSYPRAFRPIITSELNDTFVLNYDRHLDDMGIYNGFTDHMYLAMANISLGTPLPPWTTPEFFFQPHTGDHTETTDDSSKYVVSTRGFGVSPNCAPIHPFTVSVAPVDSWIINWDDCPAALLNWTMREVSFLGETGLLGRVAREVTQYGQSKTCQTYMAFEWGRSTIEDMWQPSVVQGSGILCNPTLQTAMFNVTHEASGRVISSQRTSDIALKVNDDSILKNQTDSILKHFNSDLAGLIDSGPHNDTISQDWMNYLIIISTNSRDAIDPTKSVPDPEKLLPTVEDLYRRLFAIFLSLNQNFFEPADARTVVMGRGFLVERRIFMAEPAFIITVVILGLNVMAAIMFYSAGLVSTLPRMPTSIGSMLAYVASSRMVQEDELRSKVEGTEEERTYSYGRFIGVDNKSHLGIDMDPHVALIDPDSIKEKKPLLSALRLRGWKNKRMSVRNGTWI